MHQETIPAKGVITNTSVIDIQESCGKVFSYVAAPESLPKFFQQYGPIHGIEKSVLHKGAWSAAGAVRTIHFDSGDTLREELIAFDPPRYFSYSISEFSNFAKYLTAVGYGEWWFEQKDDCTRVTWKYTFKPKNFLTGLPLSLFVKKSFSKYMDNCLQNAKKYIEANV